MSTVTPLISYPYFDGHKLSRTSCQLRFATLRPAAFLVVSGWKSITTKEELTPGETYANRAKLQGRTRGKHKPTVDVEIYSLEAENVRLFLNAAGAPLGLGWGEVSFDLMLTAFERRLGGTFAWEAFGCRIVSEELSVGDNDDELSRKWSLHCMDMQTNGLSMVRESTSTGLPG